MPITPVFREPDRPSTNCPVFRPFIRVPYSIFLYLSDSHSISRCLSVAFLQQMTIYFIYATDFSGNWGENPCSGPGSPVTSVRILFDHISFLFLFLFPVILFFLNIFQSLAVFNRRLLARFPEYFLSGFQNLADIQTFGFCHIPNSDFLISQK